MRASSKPQLFVSFVREKILRPVTAVEIYHQAFSIVEAALYARRYLLRLGQQQAYVPIPMLVKIQVTAFSAGPLSFPPYDMPGYRLGLRRPIF